MGKILPLWLDIDGEKTMVSKVEIHRNSAGTIGAIGTPKDHPLEVMLHKNVTGFTVNLTDDTTYFERPGEVYSSSTLLKVATALRDSGLSEDRIQKAMKAIQAAGILFREEGTNT